MPYIAEGEFKSGIDFELEEFDTIPFAWGRSHMANWKAGPLNYLLTKLVLKWLGARPDYERYNAAVGVLESMKLELYRRMVAPYEDAKMEENGDVY